MLKHNVNGWTWDSILGIWNKQFGDAKASIAICFGQRNSWLVTWNNISLLSLGEFEDRFSVAEDGERAVENFAKKINSSERIIK